MHLVQLFCRMLVVYNVLNNCIRRFILRMRMLRKESMSPTVMFTLPAIIVGGGIIVFVLSVRLHMRPLVRPVNTFL